MCVYCMIADWANKWIPDQPAPWSPWTIPTTPWIPGPVTPSIPVDQPVQPPSKPTTHQPWSREQLEQFEEILRRVREMEDKLGGCPCEQPEKMDFLKEIRTRLDRMDEKIESEKPDEPNAYVDG